MLLEFYWSLANIISGRYSTLISECVFKILSSLSSITDALSVHLQFRERLADAAPLLTYMVLSEVHRLLRKMCCRVSRLPGSRQTDEIPSSQGDSISIESQALAMTGSFCQDFSGLLVSVYVLNVLRQRSTSRHILQRATKICECWNQAWENYCKMKPAMYHFLLWPFGRPCYWR